MCKPVMHGILWDIPMAPWLILQPPLGFRHPHVHFRHYQGSFHPTLQARKSQTEVAISVMHRCAQTGSYGFGAPQL